MVEGGKLKQTNTGWGRERERVHAEVRTQNTLQLQSLINKSWKNIVDSNCQQSVTCKKIIHEGK